jgi:hypothetical protein
MQHFLDISYRAQEHVLVTRWMQQMRTDSDFEAGYYYLLAQARQHSCPFWLLDVRRCPPNCARQARWLLAEFCPLVAAAFGSSAPIYGAHLINPAHLIHYRRPHHCLAARPAASLASYLRKVNKTTLSFKVALLIPTE